MNKRIEDLAKELLIEIENENKKKAQKIARGNIVTVAGDEWLILKAEDQKVYCLHKNLMNEKKFDSNCNDWKESNLREFLNYDFYNRLRDGVGKENILPITTNLLSLDGQTEYGQCEDYVSLLTVDLYRENRDIIPNTGEWWWLATPWSTKCNGYETAVCVVSPRGIILNDSCDDDLAVRPFCIFDSRIFES